ncbi:MAG: putative molybdenum carrier protein [Magnetococcus sp. DMHC-6]
MKNIKGGKIISGGQTGVDRAALDFALELGLECGGWCPRGRRAEDGPIPERYPLQETASASYFQRTRENVQTAQATLILARSVLSGGTALTKKVAMAQRKPFYVVDLNGPPEQIVAVRAWLRIYWQHILNVAGPRESENRGIYLQALNFLRQTLAETPIREEPS